MIGTEILLIAALLDPNLRKYEPAEVMQSNRQGYGTVLLEDILPTPTILDCYFETVWEDGFSFKGAGRDTRYLRY